MLFVVFDICVLSVSCHCGLQSTVIQSRVWYSSRRNDQIHAVIFFSGTDGYSRNWRISLSNWSIVIQDEELWWWSCILSIPVKTINWTSVVTRKFPSLSLSDKCCFTVWGDDIFSSVTCNKSLFIFKIIYYVMIMIYVIIYLELKSAV